MRYEKSNKWETNQNLKLCIEIHSVSENKHHGYIYIVDVHIGHTVHKFHCPLDAHCILQHPVHCPH